MDRATGCSDAVRLMFTPVGSRSPAGVVTHGDGGAAIQETIRDIAGLEVKVTGMSVRGPASGRVSGAVVHIGGRGVSFGRLP